MQKLGQHLTYVWQSVTLFSSQKTSIYDRKIRTGYKGLLIFCKGKYTPRNWLIDVIEAPREKGSHPYQQPEAEASYFIQHLSDENDLVLDPFCGSTTTAAASRRLNRRCLTADVDASAVATAKERLALVGLEISLTRVNLRIANVEETLGISILELSA